MSTIPPDEERLQALLATAFDHLPEADTGRLGALEQRLSHELPRGQKRRRLPTWYWWLIGGLMATGAAAWWAGDYYWGGDKETAEIHKDGLGLPRTPADATNEKPAPLPEKKPEQSQPEDARGGQTKQPPVIYRRESY